MLNPPEVEYQQKSRPQTDLLPTKILPTLVFQDDSVIFCSLYTLDLPPPPSNNGKILVILVTIASWVGRSNASLPGRNWRGSGWPLCCCSQDLHRLKVMTGDDIFGTANLSKPQQTSANRYVYIYTSIYFV